LSYNNFDIQANYIVLFLMVNIKFVNDLVIIFSKFWWSNIARFRAFGL